MIIKNNNIAIFDYLNVYSFKMKVMYFMVYFQV